MVYPIPSFIIDQQALPRCPTVTGHIGQEEASVQMASHATRWASSDVPQVNHHHSLLSRVSWLTIYLSYIDVVMIFRSGDCGMYAIKHIEHLLCGLKLDTIIDANMSLFRKKWSVDLWYQDVGPWVFLGCTCILIKNSVYIFFDARQIKVVFNLKFIFCWDVIDCVYYLLFKWKRRTYISMVNLC